MNDLKKQIEQQKRLLVGTTIGLISFGIAKSIATDVGAGATGTEKTVIQTVPTLTLAPVLINIAGELEPKKKRRII